MPPPASERSPYRPTYAGGGEQGSNKKPATSSFAAAVSKKVSPFFSKFSSTSFWPAGASEHVRWNTSLRPVPEVYPLIGAMGVGVGLIGVIVWHHLSSNHEVYIRKSTRELGVITEEDEEAKRLTHLSKVGLLLAGALWRLSLHVLYGPFRRYHTSRDPITRDKRK